VNYKSVPKFWNVTYVVGLQKNSRGLLRERPSPPKGSVYPDD